jgi:HK97 family phage prohead protease
MERRFTNAQTSQAVQLRAEGEDRTIEGYGAIFYDGTEASEYRLYDDMVERIDESAFARAIKENQDVRGLFNHDPSLVLGRSTSGTMKLSVDKTGLLYVIQKGNTTVANDVAEHLERGDVSGSSFAMVVRGVEWHQEERNGVTVDVRTIKDVDLFDVGPVTYPAYAGTESGLRSEGDVSDIQTEREAFLASQKPNIEAEARKRKLTLLKYT